MKLAELPDVPRMPTVIDELTRPSTNYYSSISPVTWHALRLYLPYRTAVLFSGFSISLSLLNFTISFTLFGRHWKRLFLHPQRQRFFPSSQGRFFMFWTATKSQHQKRITLFFSIWRNMIFFAFQGLAKETLQINSHSNYTTDPFHPTFLHELILTFQPLINPRRRHSYCIHKLQLEKSKIPEFDSWLQVTILSTCPCPVVLVWTQQQV